MVKVLGAFLLVIGLMLAVPLVFGIVAGAAALLWTLLKVGAVALLIYVGWRWVNRTGEERAAWKANTH